MTETPVPLWLLRRVGLLGAVAIAVLTSQDARAQQLIADIPVNGWPYAIATNATTHKAYVLNQNENQSTVTVLDEQVLTTTTVSVADNAIYIAVDESANKIYVAGFIYLTVIDGATNNTTTLTLPSLVSGLAVNSATNKTYISTDSNTVIVIDGSTLSQTIVQAGDQPTAIAVDWATDKIYVVNSQGSNVTVIDGLTNSTTSVQVANYPQSIDVDVYTNKVYVGTQNTVTLIDGATLNTEQVLSVPNPQLVKVNQRANKIYVAFGGLLYVIDGETLANTLLYLGIYLIDDLTIDPATNEIYIAYYQNTNNTYGLIALSGRNNSFRTVLTSTYVQGLAVDSTIDRIFLGNPDEDSVYVLAGPSALHYVPLTPCRVVDTRLANGPLGGPPIQGGTERDFPLPQGTCNIPANAAAYSLNVTVVPQGQLHYLTVWPTGEAQPVVSTMNSDGRTKANAAIVAAGESGAVSVYASDTTNVILDINGYFEVPTSSNDLVFYPMTPCRIVDTRGPNGPFGGPYLTGNQERDFPILSSNCNIPSSAQAYSLNVTALPHGHLGYLTVWPDGQSQPVVSTLNAPTGTYVANAALVQAGSDGGIAVYPSNDTDLLVDINGYFAPPGPGGMSLYTVLPCRAVDTRQNRGRFEGTVVLDIVDSSCGLQNAEAYVFNATVIPQGSLGYLTLWPTTEFQPDTSTLNALDGAITSNMAIVTNIDGWVNAHASNWTQLLLDASAYFAP